MGMTVIFAVACAALALLFAFFRASQIKKKDMGTDEMSFGAEQQIT